MMKGQCISWVSMNRCIMLAWLLLVYLPWSGQAAAPGEFVVSQTLDGGPYSLRMGIEFANSHPGPDIIRFHSNLTGNTILLSSNLPPLTDNGTTIDASPNWIGGWPTGEPGITLRELGFNGTLVGLHLQGADNCTIKGLLIEGFQTGIRLSEGANGNTIGSGSPGGRMLIRQNAQHAIDIQNSDSNRVLGCYIGTSKAGNLPEPNGGSGVHIYYGRFNEIGQTGPLEENLIGGSYYGVEIEGGGSMNNTVMTNRIGVGNLDGDISNRNGGIWIYWGAAYNQVGGATPSTGNWISGNSKGVLLSVFAKFNQINWNTINSNDGNGISIIQSDYNRINQNYIADNDMYGIEIASATGNTVQGNTIVRNTQSGVYLWEQQRTYQNYILSNFIGTDASGTVGLGNGRHGVVLDDGAQSNQVEGNVIAQNKEGGIVIIKDNTSDNLILHNYIGLTPNGQPLGNTYYGVGVIGSPRNTIQSNVIAYNGVPAGVWISEAAAVGNGVWSNSIYNNTGSGIVLTNGGNKNLAAPSITQVQCPRVSGGGAPANGRVQVFSDSADEGRIYEGETQANSSGQWVYAGSFHGPHLTATASDSENDTSAFSAPTAGSFCGVLYLPIIRR